MNTNMMLANPETNQVSTPVYKLINESYRIKRRNIVWEHVKLNGNIKFVNVWDEAPLHLRALFFPRAPISYLPPLEQKKSLPLTGIAQFISCFEKLNISEEKSKNVDQKSEKEIVIAQNKNQHTIKLAEGIKKYNPKMNPKAVTDPNKTLFVGRLNYATTEETIRHIFEEYGRITKLVLVLDTVTGKSKGYCFIEYAHTEDMKYAFKKADGKKN